jgi:hypothetical protein
MRRRRPNHKLVKIHRNYTVEETSRLLRIHKNTVRAWIEGGLPVCKDMRPHLILGRELAAFLQSRRAKKKRPCAPGEMYCFRCRVPRIPAGGIADFIPKTDVLGNLVGICSVCSTMMCRRASVAQLPAIRAKLDITIVEAR